MIDQTSKSIICSVKFCVHKNSNDFHKFSLQIKNDKKDKKNISVKSNSSSDKSIANDSDDEVEEEPEKPKDKYLAGVCFLKMKK